MPESLNVGAAKAPIIPYIGQWMAGYRGRVKGCEAIHDHLTCGVLYLESGKARAVMITADLIWFANPFVARVKAQLQARFGLPPDSIMMSASHTHSGPRAGGPDAGDAAWLDLLEQWIGGLVAQAIANAQPVAQLLAGRGESDLVVNRRERKPDGSIVLGHNPKGPRDLAVHVLTFEGERSTLASLLHYTCHPVTLGTPNYRISRDYPGVTVDRLEEIVGAPVFFLQGAAGDQNPWVRGEFADVHRNGLLLASAAEQAALQARPIAMTPLATCAVDIDIPFADGRTAPMTLQGLRIGDVLMAGVPGELLVEYGLHLKAHTAFPVCLPLGYSNGSNGYLPTRAVLEEGGYEAANCMKLDGVPVTDGIEEALKRGLLDVERALAGGVSQTKAS